MVMQIKLVVVVVHWRVLPQATQAHYVNAVGKYNATNALYGKLTLGLNIPKKSYQCAKKLHSPQHKVVFVSLMQCGRNLCPLDRFVDYEFLSQPGCFKVTPY